MKKTQIRVGHRGLVTRCIQEADKVIEMATPDQTINTAKLAQLKLSLKEKLETVSRMDDKIVELTEKAEDLETEINKADNFKQGIYTAFPPVQLLQWDFSHKHSNGDYIIFSKSQFNS